MSRVLNWSRWVRFGLLALGGIALAAKAHAANIKIEVTLVWGTDAEKSSDESHKPVESELAKELKGVYRWKNYFVVNRLHEAIPSNQTKTVPISKKCSVEIKELPGPHVEVMLVGEGKKMNRTTYPLSKGKSVCIAGNDKNNCAWFVIIKQLE